MAFAWQSCNIRHSHQSYAICDSLDDNEWLVAYIVRARSISCMCITWSKRTTTSDLVHFSAPNRISLTVADGLAINLNCDHRMSFHRTTSRGVSSQSGRSCPMQSYSKPQWPQPSSMLQSAWPSFHLRGPFHSFDCACCALFYRDIPLRSTTRRRSCGVRPPSCLPRCRSWHCHSRDWLLCCQRHDSRGPRGGLPQEPAGEHALSRHHGQGFLP